MFRLKRYIKPYLTQFTVGSLSKLLEAALELWLPLVMARIIDSGIPENDPGTILRAGGVMLAISIVGFGFAMLCQYFASVTSQGVGTLLRHDLIEKISTFSYKELDRFGTSTLITRVTNDVNQIQQAVAMLIRLVTRAPFLCIGALIMAIRIDPGLSAVFAVLIPLFVVTLAILMKMNVPRYKNAQKQLDRVGLVFRENLSGVRVIRAFARHKKEKHRMEDENSELARRYTLIANVSALLNPITSIIMNAGILVILYFGGHQVFGGNLSRGELLALINYVTQILMALIIVSNLVILYTKASASANRINEIFDTAPGMHDGNASSEGKSDAPAIRFDHVGLNYNSAEEALHDISFALPAGQTLGVVGTTGSGKTSLINLIPRFYDATAGSVQILGTDVRDYTQRALREKIGIVPQKSVLFTGTVADNLRWGKPDATEDEMWAALRAAQSEDFVSAMDEGLNAPIFEGGKNFSGGQKQRLCIARALVKRPEILILDDSLSALDYKTDASLRQALKEYARGMTVVIVSQRLSSVAGADQILVLDDGAAVGLGSHAGLLESCKTYREIWQSQNQ